MKITIYETGVAPAPLADQFGRYPEMFIRQMSRLDNAFDFETVPVFQGAPLPKACEVQGAILTGSPAGVYEDHAWISGLEDHIRDLATAAKPAVGICFGHQLMAQAFGGRVEKSAKGWGVGIHKYAVSSVPQGSDQLCVRDIACAVSHQDQVTSVPSSAIIHAGSEFCPYGVLSYAQGPAFSMQMHPEFDHDFGAALLSSRMDRIAEDRWRPGLESYQHESDRKTLFHWIINFFKAHQSNEESI